MIFDFSHWIMRLASQLGTKSAHYCTAPTGFRPGSSIKLWPHEAQAFAKRKVQCNTLAFRTCQEIKGPYVWNTYLEDQYKKSVHLWTSDIKNTNLCHKKWTKLLARFNTGSVIYCVFGSECTQSKDQFQELLLRLELTGRA
ncbi:hypothetical protein SLEP1_g6613 [Rubroshorea leprosula]|uniref:Uncharacterized protein n=1 Tax=Rubroshorea leprosula TaxID=152421 RepID=A0AAV5HVT1_9ROSI|nr:hypothetical protein SLEP1_g6613 [Rubroshorea leprosula]